MKLLWYICFTLIFCLIGCNKLHHIEQVTDSFNRITLQENMDENTKNISLKDNIKFPKNAVVSGEALFVLESGERVLDNLSKVQLLNQVEDYYFAKYNEIKGKIKKENILFFNFDEKSKYSLMLDVSQFNKDSKFYSFHTDCEFGRFIIQNNINYLYIRIGGRGYGQKGSLYSDSQTKFYADACEYFGISFGFYFIDEALDENEAIEEANYILSILKNENYQMNKLPMAIDVEYSYGKSRADNSWHSRTSIINCLIEELSSNGYDSILYANGARIDTYLKDVNCDFWTAMYPRQNVIPQKFYDDFVKEEQSKIMINPDYLKDSFLSIDINMADTGKTEFSDEYLNKVKAWQFTEDGASKDGIEGMIDLSLVDNQYFVKFCK